MGVITLGHGSGGQLTRELTALITAPFDGLRDTDMEDCAILPGGWAVTMDGFTVSPMWFPGGSLGHLSVCGSANDLAVRGAGAEYICISVIAEEGLDTQELERHMAAAADTCRSGGITLAGGDTKVVPAGQGGELYLATCAMGRVVSPHDLKASNIKPGDAIIVTGSPGRHGAVIAAARYDIASESLQSDCALLWPALKGLLGISGLKCMRDCTRGGLGTVLCEWAVASGCGIIAQEESIPQDIGVMSVCSLLGFDSLYMACEGTAAVAVEESQAQDAVEILRKHPTTRDAAIIGRVVAKNPGWAGLRTLSGGTRLLDMPPGELLPRIC